MRVAEKGLADVVLVDVLEGVPAGKALGHFMTPPSPSELIVRLAGNAGGVESVHVGGRAIHHDTVTLTLAAAANA